MGFGAGRLAAPSPQPAAGPGGPVSGTSPRVASPPPARADAPGERTRLGAARAAASALSSLADDRLLVDEGRRRAVVAEIAPTYRAELIPVFERTYEYLSQTLGEPARRGEAVLRMTPLGYRVESFSGRRATVAVWQMTLLATPERAPIAAWSTSRAEMVWAGGRWRVERFGVDAPGPTPSVTAPATPTAAGEFVALADGLTPFGP